MDHPIHMEASKKVDPKNLPENWSGKLNTPDADE